MFLKLFSSLALGMLLFAAGVSASAAEDRMLVASVPGAGPAAQVAMAVVDGKVATVSLDDDRRILFRRGDVERRLDGLEDGGVVEREGGARVQLHARPEGLFVLWWQKQVDGGKHLYLRRSVNGGVSFEPARKINSDLGVLPTYSLTSDGHGRVAVVYHDERSPTFMVYVNVSHDAGQSWLAEDIRVDAAGQQRPFAVEPQIAYLGERLVLTWKERTGRNTLQASRFSDDGGKTWSDPHVLGESRHFLTGDILVRADSHLLWLGYISGQGVVGYLTADGANWQTLDALPGTPELRSVSHVRATALEDKIQVVYAGRKEGNSPAGERWKSRVYVAQLDLQTAQWVSEGVRLDRGKVIELTTSANPQIAATDSGRLVAAWEDFRDIRGNVFVSASYDNGASWSDPRPLGKPGFDNLGLPRILVDGDRVFMVFHHFASDVRSRPSVELRELRLTDAGVEGTMEPIAFDPDGRLARLEQRVNEFWSLRVQGKHDQVYDYFDPALRARVDRSAFLVSQRQVQYLDHEMIAARADGNIGAGLARVTMAVPHTFVSGEEFTMDPREEEIAMEWVWVGDDWYAVYTGIANTRFLRY